MGKSTTAEFFRDEGIPVFDADAAVHELYEGKATGSVEKRFPGTAKNGHVDRPALAKALIEDPTGFRDLENIIHPLVRQAEIDFIDTNRSNGSKFVVLDIPLLFESGGDELCDKVIVVTAPEVIQRARVLSRPGMTADKFAQLLNRQMNDADKRCRADFLVFTHEGVANARQQVKDILSSLDK